MLESNKCFSKNITSLTIFLTLIAASVIWYKNNLIPLRDVTCIGPTDAQTVVVYLHGYDSIRPGLQELYNRSVIKKLAEELGICFALPRASSFLNNTRSTLSWTSPWEIDLDAPRMVEQISDHQDVLLKCAPRYRKKILLGFSNGGYWTNAVFATNPLKDNLCAISVGAAGGEWPEPPLALDARGHLTLLVGSLDYFNDNTNSGQFSRHLVSRGMAQKQYFRGWHYLPYEPLAIALKSCVVRRSE